MNKPAPDQIIIAGHITTYSFPVTMADEDIVAAYSRKENIAALGWQKVLLDRDKGCFVEIYLDGEQQRMIDHCEYFTDFERASRELGQNAHDQQLRDLAIERARSRKSLREAFWILVLSFLPSAIFWVLWSIAAWIGRGFRQSNTLK